MVLYYKTKSSLIIKFLIFTQTQELKRCCIFRVNFAIRFSKIKKADNDFANQLIISASNQRSLWESNPQLVLRSMAYHVIHGSDVTSNIIPYAE